MHRFRTSPACPDIYNPFSILKAFSKMKMDEYWFASGTPTLLFESLKRFQTDLYDIDGVEASASVFNRPTESITSAIPLFYIVFSFMNVQIYTEVMNSEGRTDALMYPGDTVYIIEAELDSSPEEALRQIEEKGYATRFAGSGKNVVRLGLNFSSQTRTIERRAVQ